MKSKKFFISSVISAIVSAIFGGIYFFQEILNPPYSYAAGVMVDKSYAKAGSRIAVESLNEHYAYLRAHETFGYLFWIFLIIFIALLVAAILIKRKEQRL